MKCALLPCLGGLEIVYDCIRDLYAQCVNGRYVCCTAPPLPWWAWDCIRRGVDPSRASGRCSGSSNSWLRPGRYWCWRIPSSSEPFIPLLTSILMLIMPLKLIIQQKLIKTFNLRWTSTFPAIDAATFYAIELFNSVTTWTFCSWMLPLWIIHLFQIQKTPHKNETDKRGIFYC